MNPIKPVFYLLLISLFGLGGCSWFQKEDDCPDCNIELNKGLDAQESYFCYGKQDRTWDCQTRQDESKAIAISPRKSKSTRTEVHPPPSPLSVSAPSKFPVETAATIPTEPRGEIAGSAIPGTINLLDAPADSFTVQLIAMRKLDPVLNYASQVGIDEPLYSMIINQGHPWYVLLLGIYEDHSSAIEAKDNWIGTRVLKVDPWVRKLGPLQDAMRLIESPR